MSPSFTLVSLKRNTTALGKTFLDITAMDEQKKQIRVLAYKPAHIALAKTIPEDKPFHMEWEEQNGFRFIRSVNGKTLADQEKGDLR